MSILMALGWFLISKRHQQTWATELAMSYTCFRSRLGLSQDLLRTAQRTAVLGASAILVLSLFDEARFATVAPWPGTEKWAIFRAPLLMTLAFVLACHAVAFRCLLDGRR